MNEDANPRAKILFDRSGNVQDALGCSNRRQHCGDSPADRCAPKRSQDSFSQMVQKGNRQSSCGELRREYSDEDVTATSELPVPNVREAQEYYRDELGFEIALYNEEGSIGAVAHGDCPIFFRKTAEKISPSVFWVFTECVDESDSELVRLGADVLQPPCDKPTGLRQFTVRDAYGNLFHFFHDL